MKGIILAGGSGTRLYPITKGISKQLCPVYDKPLIYYPLSTLMRANIKDILIITTREDQAGFIRALGDGSDFGINLNYAIQEVPNGLAQAFVIGDKFINGDECAMVLGDNIFLGSGFEEKLNNARKNAEEGQATIFTFKVKDPERFGIAEFDENGNVISVEEKPQFPKSDQAITGLYFYPKSVEDYAKKVQPSARNEYEITTLNDMYLQEGRLKAEELGLGYNWYDAGLFDSLNSASNHVKATQENTGTVISCPEAIAFENGWITPEKLEELAKPMIKNSYGQYLDKLSKKMVLKRN